MKHANAALLLAFTFAAMPLPGVESAHGGHEGTDNAIHSYVLLDRLEIQDSDSGTGLGWDMKGWIGTDLTRLWFRSEGETVSGHTAVADVEALYGRSISTWWDLVAGVRHDFRPGDSQTFGAIGVQGLAPQRIELAATFYLGQGARSAARLAAEYELLLTNRLVLQPRMELNAYGKTDVLRGIGSGLSTVQAGLRLRYEFTRQFAPYVGIDWERSVGKTADLGQGASGGVSDLRVVAGVRAWF